MAEMWILLRRIVSVAQIERAMDGVDWLGTSADAQVLSVTLVRVACGHNSVICCCGFWLFCIDPWIIGFSRTATSCVFGLGLLCARLLVFWCTAAFLNNFSATAQGVIVKLHRASSEFCTLDWQQCRDGKTALARGPWTILVYVGKKGGGLRVIGVSGSRYNEVWALEVLNVVDRVEHRRRADFPAPASASRLA